MRQPKGQPLTRPCSQQMAGVSAPQRSGLLHAARVVVLVLLFSLWPAFVAADDSLTAQVEELSGQAVAAYGAGEFERAIELFNKAYELQQVANILFNIAKIYEKIEDWDAAQRYYRDFIKARDADSAAREVALQRLEAIKEIKAALDRADKPPEGGDVVVDAPPVEPEKPKRSPIPWIVLGSGGAIAAGGGVFGILAMGTQKKFDAAESADDKRELRKSGKTQAMVADTMYAVGAVTAITGVVLLFVMKPSDSAKSSPSPTVWLGPAGEPRVGFHFKF